MRRVLVVLIAVLGLALARSARAQCAGTQANGNSVPASIVFPTPTETDFAALHVDYSATLVTSGVGTNKTWWLCFSANTATLGSSTAGTYVKPLSDLLVKLTSEPEGAFRPVTQTQRLLGTFTGKTSVSFDVRIVLASGVDEPGRYATNLLLTAYK